MNESQFAALDQQLAESFLFTPYLGANVSIYSDRWGNWQGACGYCDPQTQTPIPKAE